MGLNMHEFVLPAGSCIFVTGVSGLIGSHVADQLLARGYAVRGSVRDVKEAQMMDTIFQQRHTEAHYESRIISDMKQTGAFDEHLAGCAGVAHVASDLSFNPDPEVVITGCVNAIRGILEAASNTSTVKRFVYTSSSNAATNPVSGTETKHISSESWNDEVLQKALAPPPYEEGRGYAVYAASKVACERAAWEYVRTRRPSFSFSTVLPNYTTGLILQPMSVPGAGSTARWVRDAFEHPDNEESISKIRDQDPQWQVDVEDVAKLHLAALLLEDVNGERLFAFSKKFNYNEFLEVFRKLAPDRTFPENDLGQRMPSTVVDTQRSVELLRRFGQDRWVGFEESVTRSCLGGTG